MEERASKSVAGQPEMSQSAETTISSTELNRKPSLQPGSSAKLLVNAQTSLSTSNSPRPSRETSPIRLAGKPAPQRIGPGRSRKNSSQEPSPSRSTSTNNPPSSTTTNRVLSATSIPQLQRALSDVNIAAPAPRKAAATADSKETPRWPVSPRLRSPPPVIKTSLGSRAGEQDLPQIGVQKATPVATSQASLDAALEDSQLLSETRATGRGVSGTSSTLETVQEISQTPTPITDADGSKERNKDGTRQTISDNVIDEAFANNLKTKSTTATTESGSDSGGNKNDTKKRATSMVPPLTPRPSIGPNKSQSTAVLSSGRGKPSAEGSTKNMTVETETVSSIPQVAVGGGAGGPGFSGSIRAKPSSETIRPKKEKKRTARKVASVPSGAASSKADIFEAQIASAVDEANSSDSEETFVYESNPPDAGDRPRRFHSRTPSVTSMASQLNQQGHARSVHGIMDSGHSVALKKSMKFTNSYNNGLESATGDDDGKGTVRTSTGTGRGTPHHHHIGRWGRNGGHGHASLFDNESPFPNAAKAKVDNNNSRASSRPTSPKMANSKRFYSKKGSPNSLHYDMDDGAGADDETTPLISTFRSARSGRHRRPNPSQRQLEHQGVRRERTWLTRFAGCLVLAVMLLLTVSGAVSFIFATTQPLSEVEIVALRKVLASGQELMFDMDVIARNPNILTVTIDSMSIDLFAKSKHAGTDSEWWKRPQLNQAKSEVDGVETQLNDWDDFWDPPSDGDDQVKIPLLRLGRVYEFDSPLSFDGSPFRHVHTISSGQVRLAKPGNATEPAGSERWDRVLKHEFELVIKGTLRYQLPLIQRVRSVSVDGKVLVKSDQGDSEDEVHI